MSETAWARWRAAEQKGAADQRDAQGGGGAASGLPARQAWILRALAALEARDRAALETLRRTAPAQEFRAVAEIALSDPGSIDPTRFRAYLKQVGVRTQPLPCLDLLRLACAAHNGEKPARSQKLANAARARPVLNAALMVLSPLFKAYKIESPLLERSPRMASFWAAGIGQHLTDGSVRDYVRTHLRGVELLPEANWPDLVPIGTQGKHASKVSLAEFLRDPISRPWSEACSLHVRVLSTRAEGVQRLAALGGLLDAIDTLIRKGTPIASIPAVQAALRLAEASPEVRQRNVLLNQLQLLEMRLFWASRDFPDELLEPLWRGLDSLPADERAQCAREILEGERAEPLPRAIAAEVLAFAIRGGASWKEDVLPWMLAHGGALDLRAFQAALRDAPGPTRELALGHLHALHHSTVEACRIAARLFEHGARDDATRIALSAFAREVMAPSRGRQERRLNHRARLDVARAAAASSPPPSAEFVVGLMVVATVQGDEQIVRETFEFARPCAQARLALPPEPQHHDLIHRLHLMTMVGLDDQAQEEFRDFGRWLRRGRLEEALPAALRVCAVLCVDDEAVAGYDLDGETSTPAKDPHPGWLRSLTSWLDHQDSEAVARCALALAHDGSVPARSLLRWFEGVSDLEENDAWEDLCALAAMDDEGFQEYLRGTEDDIP